MRFEVELWWLLVIPPVFFGLGWLAARIDIKHLLSESRALPGSYFKGLNFLLNEQPDKAIEAFIEVVKVDPQTIELHFALGNLFRRQGEVERAIRMHQNLLERSDLPQDRRLAAMYELALDYFKAGLLDRAEDHFGKLAGTPFEHQAQTHLLQIFEQEKDWTKAIAVRKRLETIRKQPYAKEIAHYYCELAASEILNSRLEKAREYLLEALAEHRKCTRATMLLGDIAHEAGDHEGAIERWKTIENQDPSYLSLVADRLAAAYKLLGKNEELLRLLRGYQEQYPSLDLLNVLFRTVLEQQGPRAASELIKEELRRNPTLLGLDKLLEAELLNASFERRHDIELVKGLVQQHTRRLGTYRCDHCGFRAKQYFWRCPGCGQWETYSPRRSETPEGVA